MIISWMKSARHSLLLEKYDILISHLTEPDFNARQGTVALHLSHTSPAHVTGDNFCEPCHLWWLNSSPGTHNSAATAIKFLISNIVRLLGFFPPPVSLAES